MGIPTLYGYHKARGYTLPSDKPGQTPSPPGPTAHCWAGPHLPRPPITWTAAATLSWFHAARSRAAGTETCTESSFLGVPGWLNS